MRLSNLSLLYIALCAFMAASVLVVHMNYAETQSPDWSTPFSFTSAMSDGLDGSRTTHQTVALQARLSPIEM